MKKSDYSLFAKDCVDKLKLLQEKFQKDYTIGWYQDWFYNQATGLLTFSTGEVELNFRYFDIGSYSEKTGTWKWSWDNDSTFENVKKQTELIRAFGLKYNFQKLTDGYFESDEFEAWEFVAIAAILTNAIGVYRPVNDKKLQIFLVITGFVDNETAKRIKEKYVKCGDHEYRRVAFVCTHLNHKDKVGFNEAFETFEAMELSLDDDFQAWCDDCENIRLKEGEWNDTSMALTTLKIVCEQCYFEMKELNLGYK